MNRKKPQAGKPSERNAAIIGQCVTTNIHPQATPQFSSEKARILAIAKAKAERLNRRTERILEERETFVDPQILVHKWKTANADETNDMEALPPIAQKLQRFDNMPGFPSEPFWLIICYGGFAVRITKGIRTVSEHKITLHTRHEGKNANLGPIVAEAWTQEFVFTKAERALEQYMRVLCEDII